MQQIPLTVRTPAQRGVQRAGPRCLQRSFALAALLLASGPSPARGDEAAPEQAATARERGVEGPDETTVPILRPAPGYPRIFVQARLPDGELGLFLVDTGADISVLSEATAERLGLEIARGSGIVQGISGAVPMDGAVIPELSLGPEGAAQVVKDVEVAVGVRGLSDQVGFMPLDGLLGNNVWSRFVLEIDYPADTIVLHAPDTVALTRRPARDLWRIDKPSRVAPMVFNGQHIFSPVTLTTDGDDPATATIVAQIDTGAGELTLCAATGQPFRDDTTQGLESVRGIGASETLPPHRFLEMTRRIPLSEVLIGGRRFDVHSSARWMLYDREDTDQCGTGMRALLGHEYLEGKRVIFDYENARMVVRGSRSRDRGRNGHAVLLEQDIARYGPDRPDRALFRARLQVGAGEDDAAIALLQRVPVTAPPEEIGEARVLLARLERHQGDLDAAWEALAPLGAGELVDEAEIIGSVNGLLFTERPDEALALAQEALDARPEAGDAWVARADARLFAGDADGANADLLEAARLEEYPDAHLLRRARVALVRGDRYGAMAHVRKLLRLYPFGGEFLWFYAMLVEDDQDAATFRTDMDDAMARLHPQMQPIDFRVAALHVLGDDDQARDLMDQGIDEMCGLASSGSPENDNCLAWFWALAGVHGDEALRRIDQALAATGDRSDFLDTKAMVHLSRGELDQAVDAAWAAVRLSPDDVYMLWQAERIRDLRDQRRHAAVERP